METKDFVMKNFVKVGVIGALGASLSVLAGCCLYPCSSMRISSVCIANSCVSPSSLASMQIGFSSSADLSVSFAGTNFSTLSENTIDASNSNSTSGIDISGPIYVYPRKPTTVIEVREVGTGQLLDAYHANTSFRGQQASFSDPSGLDAWVVSAVAKYGTKDVEISINMSAPSIKKANIYSTQEAKVSGFSIKAGSETLASGALSIGGSSSIL